MIFISFQLECQFYQNKAVHNILSLSFSGCSICSNVSSLLDVGNLRVLSFLLDHCSQRFIYFIDIFKEPDWVSLILVSCFGPERVLVLCKGLCWKSHVIRKSASFLQPGVYYSGFQLFLHQIIPFYFYEFRNKVCLYFFQHFYMSVAKGFLQQISSPC